MGIPVPKGKENDCVEFILDLPVYENGVIAVDDNPRKASRIRTNVPWIISLNDSGLCWGYCGSGPTAFARNILEVYLRQTEYDGDIQYSYGSYSFKVVDEWESDFVDQFLVPMPPEGGTIPSEDIAMFLYPRLWPQYANQ